MKNLLTLALAFASAFAWAQPNLTPVFVECTPGDYPNEISWTIYTCDSTDILAGGAPFFGAGQFPDPDRFIIHMEDSYGDGWNGAYLIIGDVSYGFLSDVDWIDSLGTWPQDQPELWITVGCNDPVTNVTEVSETVFTPTRYYNLMGQQVTLREEGYYIATDGVTSRLIYRRED